MLVTRPDSRAGDLCKAIEAKGGKALSFPVLEIESGGRTIHLEQFLDCFDQYDLVIFVSVYAVKPFIDLARSKNCRLESASKFAAIGPKTSQALFDQGLSVAYLPDSSFDSDGLLACLSQFDAKGKRVAILRGQDGRERIAEELTVVVPL